MDTGAYKVSLTRKLHALSGWPNSLSVAEPGGTRVSQRDALFFSSLLLGPVCVEALPCLVHAARLGHKVDAIIGLVCPEEKQFHHRL